MQIAAGKFKAQCLKLMDRVKEHHEKIVITKYGKPIAQLVPVEEDKPKPLFGSMKGCIEIEKDVISSLVEQWEVDEN